MSNFLSHMVKMRQRILTSLAMLLVANVVQAAPQNVLYTSPEALKSQLKLLSRPDIIPWRKAQMKNSYSFFHRYKGKLSLVAMAVQEPMLTYKNPSTARPFSREEFIRFATDYLGTDIIFWSASTPWLTFAPGAPPA